MWGQGIFADKDTFLGGGEQQVLSADTVVHVCTMYYTVFQKNQAANFGSNFGTC